FEAQSVGARLGTEAFATPLVRRSEIRLLLARGEAAAAAELLDAYGELATQADPDAARACAELMAELHVLRGREQEALAAVRSGLETVAASRGGRRAGRLLLLGLRAAGALAQRGRAGGGAALVAEGERAGEQLLELGRSLEESPLAADAPPCVVTTPAVLAQWAAEWTRLAARDDRAAWRAAADRWGEIGRPQPRAACLL